MPSIWDALAGVGIGLGTAGSAIAQERQRAEELKRQQARDALLEREIFNRERQVEAERTGREATATIAAGIPELAPHAPLLREKGGAGIVTMLAGLAAKTREKEREKAEAIAAGRMVGPHIPQSADTPTMAFTSEEEGAGMSPAIQPADPRAKLTRSLIESGRLPLEKALPFLFPKPIAIAETTTGFMDPNSRQITPVPGARQPAEPPPERAGFRIKTHIDPSGRKSYTQEQSPERTMSERYAEAEQRLKANPEDPHARQNFEQAKIAFEHEKDLARARGEGAASARPISETTATALAAHQNILASLHLLETFTPDEIQRYAGLLNRPMQDVMLALQGMAPGMFGSPDQRFADFKALMGRLQGTAFGEGGKALTGIELAIVRLYTPTGREAGGAAEIKAKTNNLKLYTIIARDVRIQMAKTGREDLDPEMLDRLIREGMQKAGLPLPGETRTKLGGPAGVGNTTATPQTQRWGRDAQGRPVRLE